MKIFTHRSGTNRNAIFHYRQEMPLYWMHANRKVRVTVDDLHPSTTFEQRRAAFHNADFVYLHSIMGAQMYETFEKVNKAIPQYNTYTGEVTIPPAFVLDMDDRYDLISYLNPAFGFYGHTRPDGSEMEPGDKITVETADAGEMVLWEDGKTFSGEGPDARGKLFSAEENRKRMQIIKNHARDAALVVCSTPRLRDGISNDWGRTEDIIVYPNSVRKDDFPVVELPPTDHIRILWQGGQSHHEDLFEVTESMGRLAHKYPDIKWVFFGAEFSWVLKAIPEPQREYIPWVPYEEHRTRMAIINHDIALCPIRKTAFNDAKSAIKWYESSLRHRPAATLAANWGAYRDEMTDGVSGLLYDNVDEFEAKLELLINNEQLRRKLGAGAQEWIWANRDVEVTTPHLYEALAERLERHRRSRRVFIPKTVDSCDKLFRKA